jgi:formylglycine-generating enzyme required for sulfatase activity
MAVDAAHAPDHKPKAKIFISYSRKDLALADRLDAALKARGFEPLIDREEIYAFEDWWKRLQALIAQADTVVFVLSPDSVASREALREVEYASSLNKRFAPIVCRDVEDSAVPEALRRLNFVFFDDPTRFEASADKLAEALQTDIGWIRRHTEFGDTAHRWVEAARPNGMLLRPPVLDQAEAWLTFRPHGAPAPTAETEGFIAQSRKTARSAQRVWRLALASTFTFMVATILGLVGWIEHDVLQALWRYETVIRPFMAANISPYVLKPAREQVLKPKDTFRECIAEQDNDFCPEMIVVPAGSLIMGSPLAEKGRWGNEGPQHQVAIAQPFAVSKYPLTFDEWETCVANGYCPQPQDEGWGRGRRPVVNVSWYAAEAYVHWLSEVTAKPYRLLSETEYEYAARAGTQTAYPWGDDIGKNNANCTACGSKWDRRQTAPVGSFAANGFGLYDMVGNVGEWVEDCYHENYLGAPIDGSAWTSENCGHRVTRGGSWLTVPDGLRSASRNTTVVLPDMAIGFRGGPVFRNRMAALLR